MSNILLNEQGTKTITIANFYRVCKQQVTFSFYLHIIFSKDYSRLGWVPEVFQRRTQPVSEAFPVTQPAVL